MTQPPPREEELAGVATVAGRIRASMETALSGLDGAITAMLATVIAGGHLLIEDVPGVGKTTLARAFASSIDASVGRIQFTPDLLPSDVTGVSIFRSDSHVFEFRPGPVFAQVVIADEINRASPKTQAALLEAMQERAVTVDGITRELPEPFLVVATQNPVEMEGTYPLPEAQRDRFMTHVSVGYPTARDEMAMLESHDGTDPLAHLTPVADAATVSQMRAIASRVHASAAAKQYIVDLARATREEPHLALGASPRAALQLLAASKARAAMAGRAHVLPDDIKALTASVFAHRLIPSAEARLAGQTAIQLCHDIVARVPIPASARDLPARREPAYTPTPRTAPPTP